MLKKTEFQIQKIKDRVEAAHMMQAAGMEEQAGNILKQLAEDILEVNNEKK